METKITTAEDGIGQTGRRSVRDWSDFFWEWSGEWVFFWGFFCTHIYFKMSAHILLFIDKDMPRAGLRQNKNNAVALSRRQTPKIQI